MSIAPIIPLIGQLLSLSLKIADIVDKSEDLNVEDKNELKDIIRRAQSGVKHWEAEQPEEEVINIEDYRNVLAGIYSAGDMPAQEYKSNAQVIDAMGKAYFAGNKQETQQLKDSIDRTIRRYKKQSG